jgi:glycerophosphoryl diester phosphodiesterase
MARSSNVTTFKPRRGARRLVFAHRGGAALAPENTMEAFEYGLSTGADGLELDVHLSADNVPVVIHDALLQRTTNASGPVCLLRADELAMLDAAYYFDAARGFPRRDRRLGVPRLAEVLQRFRDIPIIIELKVNSTRLAGTVVDTLRAADAIDRVCVGSFYRRVLRAVRRLEPAIATGASFEETRWAVYRTRVRWPIGRNAYRAYQIPEMSGSTRVISPRFVKAAHTAGVLVEAWTVDDPADMRRLLEWGVDDLITDRPDLAVPLVKEWMEVSRT